MESNKPKNDNITPFDGNMMQRCLQLARQAEGYTAPNPLVGCVILREGNIVGEGYHPEAGQPHAEVFALRQAGNLAEGATLYVNLEPCNHYGRTPPCSEAIIAAKITKVFVGMVDPDRRVAGGGIDRLRQGGIEVIVGVEEAKCRQLNEAFIHRSLYQRPWGVLKYAMTLDGKIAATSGHSAWVTGPRSRHRVHQERAIADAVIVGGNTVRRDNPHLTTHGVSPRNPLRVVMSRTLDLPLEANLWQVRENPTLVLTQTGANSQQREYLQNKGVEVVEFPELTPDTAMQHLGDRGFSRILWECGGVLAAQAIAQGAVQKIMAFVSPKIIGGSAAPSPVGDLGFTKMTDALLLEQIKITQIDADLLIEGYLQQRKV
ncbi:bifunctional diaminohydroxyphosphoribosylaminopyrimidine deaminase/5-amino-6-(5-phosphoribosylamino)uracil reductase RibD [Spirulina sp. 06S082]|uniref:bifunctional diaminohydroxyphosphoribosylaminopyrimidine deaminase/5-amino-6-(5-phosphoribosylamino)uracil reductase RibD n=1 Tax=Spirulina sp. 06S082 TaxID=3110248 RepID=UPI002B1FEC84|nr:bifunctional diaminohydroxyphosphoribosylaminopyrimidine deaminase/5-amino-6-(5-phosphoribosylamino)uracil reductase RibD [Spirulina sp. 06S082]